MGVCALYVKMFTVPYVQQILSCPSYLELWCDIPALRAICF